MRKRLIESVEKCRVVAGKLASTKEDGRNGAFYFEKYGLWTIVSDGTNWRASGLPGKPWEHVSVSVAGYVPGGPVSSLVPRLPTWDEMCAVKDVFWEPEETVIQFHPKESEYVNDHPYVLHLWKPHYDIQLPPSICVGRLAR